MKNLGILIAFIFFTVFTYAQPQYRTGGVSIINAKGKRYTESYHKLQIGSMLPGSMPSRKNLWYSKPLNYVIQGAPNILPMNLRYAWSSNRYTEFIIQGDFEQVAYYDELIVDATTHRRNFYTLSIGFNYKWLYYKDLTLYSGLTVGGSYGNYRKGKNDIAATNPEGLDTENWFAPSGQITGIGMTFGRKFGGFLELAFGTKGILSGGVYLKM